MLSLLQDDHQKPDGHTFASLLHACCQAGDQTLAHKVYHNALDAGYNQSLMIYDAAISSCQSPVDLDMAMQIYADMQRCVRCYLSFCRLSAFGMQTCQRPHQLQAAFGVVVSFSAVIAKQERCIHGL